MICQNTDCMAEFSAHENAEVEEGSALTNIELRVICPTCSQLHYTFIALKDLTTSDDS